MIFHNLPIEIWQLILDKLISRVDLFCLKLSCKFFYRFINDPKKLMWDKSLIHYLIRSSDQPIQLNWMANKCGYSIKYRNLTHILKNYANIYTRPEFNNSYYIEFTFNNFEITTPINKKSRMGKYLLHKGIVK